MDVMIFESTFLFLLASLSGSCVSGWYSKNAAARARDHILNHSNYTSRDFPVLDSNDAVDLALSLQFYAMLDLNERDQTITTASWLTLQWTDQRLVWDPAEFDGVDLLVMYLDEIWTPKIFLGSSFTSSTSVVSTSRGGAVLTSDGVVHLGAPLVVTTQCPLNILYFPFDAQSCPFSFAPENQYREQVNLHAVSPAGQSYLQSSEWDLVGEKNSTNAFPFYNYISNRPVSVFPVAMVCLYLQRNPAYYITNLILPSTILNLMAILTFITPPDSGERISLGVSLVLGLTVFQILVSDSLPTASKEYPILSNYLNVNFILACLAVPFSLMSINLVSRESRPTILRHRKTREIFLEFLPRAFLVPTFSERSRDHSGHQVEVKPSRDGDKGSILTIVTVATELSERKKVAPLGRESPQNEENERNLGPSLQEQKDEEGEPLSNTDKIKMESRTLSMVLDRIGMLFIFMAFVFLVAFTFIRFLAASGAPVQGECASQGTTI